MSMSAAPHYGVIYDSVTLAPRRVIVPSDPFAQSLFDGTHKAEPGEVLCTIEHAAVAHLVPVDPAHAGPNSYWEKRLMPDLEAVAREAIRRHAGRDPPSLRDVHEQKL